MPIGTHTSRFYPRPFVYTDDEINNFSVQPPLHVDEDYSPAIYIPEWSVQQIPWTPFVSTYDEMFAGPFPTINFDDEYNYRTTIQRQQISWTVQTVTDEEYSPLVRFFLEDE